MKEQLLYELGDPRNYITPDCIADFTAIQLQEAGEGRVRVRGVRGRAATPYMKISISYHWGWKATGTLVGSWPGALEKARAADRFERVWTRWGCGSTRSTLNFWGRTPATARLPLP